MTAYPLVVNKWQANPDPETISLPVPALMEQCLHAGVNILKSTDLMNDWMNDSFTKDFSLVITSANGFRREFPLKKNIGMGGWELNLTKEDLNSFPKIQMTLDSVVTGKRGFNEVKSPRFDLPIPVGNSWELNQASQQMFSVGGKRTVTLRNQMGSCKCLQAVVYKPSFGGQFVFEANSRENPLVYSADGRDVSFEIDTGNFQAGQGQLELKQFGGETAQLNIQLYPAPPEITDVKMAKGDNRAVIYGINLDQLKAVFINNKRALVVDNNTQIINQNSNPNTVLQNSSSVLATPSQKTVVFENAGERLLSNSILLELELGDNRIYPCPKKFTPSLARPAIISNDSKEVEAIAAENDDSAKTNKSNSLISLYNLPVFPVKTTEVSVIVQNALTDYDFKIENIQVETKIENSSVSSGDLPKADFEVLDQKKIRISFPLNEQTQRLLAGRRLQFRITDKERGSSDWYSIQNTFVRMPESMSVKCTSQMNGQCELTGEGIEYISRVSVDGGKTWFPEQPATLNVQPSADGRKLAMIPFYSNKKLLQIKLGDFPSGSGLIVENYSFLNLSRRKN